jgi:hypothetical protein
MYITFPWLGVIVKFVPDFVYPESAHVGRATAFAAEGKEKVIGIAASKPRIKVEVVNRLVSFLRKDANPVTPHSTKGYEPLSPKPLKISRVYLSYRPFAVRHKLVKCEVWVRLKG